MTTPWPFSIWGIDIIGKIVPKAFNGYWYIIVAINYSTKWVEANIICQSEGEGYGKLYAKKNIICRYGVPCELILDHGSHFQGEVVPLVEKYKIAHHLSSPYRPQTNGVVEAANKNVKAILEKMKDTYKD